jgi:hypothetical protein
VNNIQRLAAEAALTKMAEQGYFDICTIDKIRSAAGVGRGEGEAYKTLSMLHCIHYDKMPGELRDALPSLVAEVLQEPAIEFSLRPAMKTLTTIDQKPAKAKGLIARIWP